MSYQNLTNLLLAWYQKNGRELPWRVKGGAHSDPYVVLVSEFMLQQTTVKTVIPYFYRFMARFPTIFDLAKANLEEVYQLWQGLGYYSRARSLHTTAQIIVQKFDGKFPQTREEVLKLKGIGAYTVASFLALAFNLPETVIDGNVMRIIARLYHLTAPLDEITDIIQKRAAELTSPKNSADYASAIMDLGATVCTPKNPQCPLCPWQKYCQSKDKPDLEAIPYRKKISKKEQTGIVYLIYNDAEEIFIRKRTEKGLLSGLYEFPWNTDNILLDNAKDTQKTVTHIFTHIKLTLHIFELKSNYAPTTDGFFVPINKLKNYALSTLMKKILKKAKEYPFTLQ